MEKKYDKYPCLVIKWHKVEQLDTEGMSGQAKKEWIQRWKECPYDIWAWFYDDENDDRPSYLPIVAESVEEGIATIKDIVDNSWKKTNYETIIEEAKFI